MKTISSIIVTMLVVTCVFSQTPLKLVKERVGNPDILKNWEVGVTKTVNEVEILRLEGENNYDFITNVFYTPITGIMHLLECKAQAETMVPAEMEALTQHYTSELPGGQISFFVSRPTKALAEPTNFSIQVLDESGRAVWSGMLSNEEPYYYRWEIWYYYKTINLPVAMGERFTIKVDDAGTRKSYKFQVNQNPTAIEPQFDITRQQNSF